MRRASILVVLLLLPLAAPASTAAISQFLPWGSLYGYCITEHNASCEPTRVGKAPFGENEGAHCGSPLLVTPWLLDSDLTATTAFVIPPGVSRVRVEYMIDNGIEATFSGAVTGTVSDFRGDCDFLGKAWLPASPGVAQVTVRAQDYGTTLAIFDMAVSG